jgi:3-dehydroquinate dehydratase II
MKVLYLFGPSLGALGTRAPELYGPQTLAEIMAEVEERARRLGHETSWEQSDAEADLIGRLLGAGAQGVEVVVLNPGALGHYSYALRDAVDACAAAVIEVHMTNVYAREEFRRRSVIAPVARASLVGAGAGVYHLALEAIPWITR